MSAVPQNPRRMLAKQEEGNNAGLDQHYGLLDLYDIKEFPMWLSTSDRLLLRLSPADLKADAVVAQDGRGNYGKTVVVSSKNVKDGSTTFTSATFVLLVTKTLFMFILLGSFTESVISVER